MSSPPTAGRPSDLRGAANVVASAIDGCSPHNKKTQTANVSWRRVKISPLCNEFYSIDQFAASENFKHTSTIYRQI